jgi:hypothetical protein
MIEFVRRQWCRYFHQDVLRPVRGKYTCAKCLRDWPVHWEMIAIEKRVSSQRLQTELPP